MNKKYGRHSTEQLIKWHSSELKRMQCDLRIETNRDRLATLQRNIEAKTKFLARLEREVAAEGIETIPGADEFDRWSKI